MTGPGDRVGIGPEDRERLESWWQAVQERPGELPPGLTEVHRRLIRSVGRGVLPGGQEVYLKSMGFPRSKDRRRYALRPLPAIHEARMLEWLAGRGVLVPEVVFVAGARRSGCPHAAVLVTAALPVVSVPPDPTRVAAAIAGLVDARVFHPDLHPGNFLTLADGRVAVLDLQSARVLPWAVPARVRRGMLVKLLASVEDPEGVWARALVAAGLCRSAEVDPEAGPASIQGRARGLRRRHLRRRIERCLQESSLFSVRRGWGGTLYSRRAAPGSEDWIEGGEELVRYWIGDRALEMLDGRPPCLGALFRPAPWSSSRHRLRVPGGASVLATASPALSAGHDRYVELVNTPSA